MHHDEQMPIPELMDSRSARRAIGRVCTRADQPQLLEGVELSPGGRRKHVLQRTSPGGTTRSSQYTSPNRAEVYDSDDPDDEYDMMGMEQWRRRCLALEYVPGQKTEAQRRAKRARASESSGP